MNKLLSFLIVFLPAASFMKKFVIILCMMSVSITAQAKVSKAGALECFTQAQKQLSFASESATKLCAGSISAAPVACVIDAYKQFGLAPNGSGAELCAKAISSAPVECVLQAKSKLGLSANGSGVELCAEAVVASAPAECVVEAMKQLYFAGNGSALQLCKKARSLAPVECAVKARDEKYLGTSSIIELCKEK